MWNHRYVAMTTATSALFSLHQSAFRHEDGQTGGTTGHVAWVFPDSQEEAGLTLFIN